MGKDQGLPRQSTLWVDSVKDVDARIKSAQDDFKSFPGSATQAIFVGKNFTDNLRGSGGQQSPPATEG